MKKSKQKTYTFTNKTLERLSEMKKKTKIGESKLLRMFINYFDRNEPELKKMIKGDYDVD